MLKQIILNGLTFGGKVWHTGEVFDPADYPTYDFTRPDFYKDYLPPALELEPEVLPVPEPEQKPVPEALVCPYCKRVFKRKDYYENHVAQCTMAPDKLQPGVAKA